MKKYLSLLIMILLIPSFISASTEADTRNLKLEFSTSDDTSIKTYALFGVSGKEVELDSASDEPEDIKSVVLIRDKSEREISTTQYLWWKVVSASSAVPRIMITIPSLDTGNISDEVLIPEEVDFGNLSEDSDGCTIRTLSFRGTEDISGLAEVNIEPLTVGFRGCLPFTITLPDSEVDKALADSRYHTNVKVSVEFIE